MSSEKSKEMDENISSTEVKDSEKNKNQNEENNTGSDPKMKKNDQNSDETQKSESANTDVADEPNKPDEKEMRISELEEELKTMKDTLLRKAAELENVRKRVQRERIQLYEDAKVAALEDFMPVSDDLIRTLKAAEESKIEDSFLQGVEMVNKKFLDVLNKYNVQRIDEINVPFDIDLHDAMLKQPAPDEKTESGTVLQVLESGYKIGNRTVKHAKVIVSE